MVRHSLFLNDFLSYLIFFYLGGPFYVDATRNKNGTWTRHNQVLDFSNFALFNSSKCDENSTLQWLPCAANCDWPCGKLKCSKCQKRRFGLCITG